MSLFGVGAYYNEIDPYAAQMLRNLIAAGHIAPGDVDTRSIIDVSPDDLRGYTQCHFFAGFGIWSLALRRAGWRDDRPIWTASCPCQPFSVAGMGVGFDDQRHLWPYLYFLARERARIGKLPTFVGEQVASKNADAWLDLVQTDLEALGYAFGAIAFPSAGVGAPHIRDRTYWAGIRLADADSSAGGQGSADVRRRSTGGDAQPWAGSGGGGGVLDGMGDANNKGLEGLGGGSQAEGGWLGAIRPATAPGEFSGMAYPDGRDASAERQQRGGEQRQQQENGRGAERLADAVCAGLLPSALGGIHSGEEKAGSWDGEPERFGAAGAERPGPTNGFWRDADWLGCRDGKWRPVEPGAFPLVNGDPGGVGRVRADQERLAALVPRKDQGSRVGRLRGYGNAINAYAAQAFIESLMECLP